MECRGGGGGETLQSFLVWQKMYLRLYSLYLKLLMPLVMNSDWLSLFLDRLFPRNGATETSSGPETPGATAKLLEQGAA